MTLGYLTDNIWMIQIPDNEVSQTYKNMVLPSWEKHGYEINMFDAVTPDNIHNYDYLEFQQYWGFRDFTTSEKAGFYSHVELWKKCIEMDEPIAIIEHDVELYKPNIKIMSDLFGFSYFKNEEAWKNYAGRWHEHPYWGRRRKICPITHAYYVSPKMAHRLYLKVLTSPQKLFVDCMLFQEMNLDDNYIIEHCGPVFDKNIGNTMAHAGPILRGGGVSNG